MQLIDVGILLQGQHQTLAGWDFKLADTFDS
jgi:hypothetical protein